MNESVLDPGVVASTRRVALPGGRVLVVRRVTVDDIGGLDELGLASRVERVATAEARGGFGIVAIVRGGREATGDGATGDGAGRYVGHAGYELLPNGDGQLAMTVAPEWGSWLGPFLLDALLAAAAAREVPNLEIDVPAGDLATRAMVLSHGCAALPGADATAIRMIVGTHGATPSWPGPHDRPRVLVEMLDGDSSPPWAGDGRLQVLVCPGPRAAGPACPALAGDVCRMAAGADAVVIVPPPGHPRLGDLMVAHRAEHPGVPVFVQRADGDPAALADVVEGVARTHAHRSDGWLG